MDLLESSTEHTNTLGRRRCCNSNTDEGQRLLPRLRDLPIYYGRDIQEAQSFLAGAEQRFCLNKGYYYPDDTSKIDFCVLAFNTKPERQWQIFKEDAGGPGNTTWAQFKEHVFELICDTENRRTSALVSLTDAFQKEGQTVDDFAAELQVYERELGYTEDGRQADTLLGRLRSGIRFEISRRGPIPQLQQRLYRAE